MSGPPGLSGEIPGAGADADRAVAPRVGGDRGARPRPGRHGPGGAGDGDFDLHDRPRAQRTAVASTAAAGTRAAAGWGPEADDRQGPHAAARSGGAGRANHLGGPGLAPALDCEEHPDSGADAAEPGPPHQPPTGARALERRRVQLASQPQDARRPAAQYGENDNASHCRATSPCVIVTAAGRSRARRRRSKAWRPASDTPPLSWRRSGRPRWAWFAASRRPTR